jgi:hypothetical protein
MTTRVGVWLQGLGIVTRAGYDYSNFVWLQGLGTATRFGYNYKG